MDEKSSGGDGTDARMGMIQVNDLVYKLEPDLSVAINRTHKTQFFQNQNYTNSQTSIAIINSGADYIDPRRSMVSFDMRIPQTKLGVNINNPDYANAFISAYFGKNGSVLNIIDSVVVSSRSGDELSRVNDYAQLMAIMLPEMFGTDWRDSIGQEIGYGSILGGYNDSTVVRAQPPLYNPKLQKVSEQRRTKFSIPLYLLSPIFNYGRLLPSMLMSGLRIEIKWKTLDQACQLFWEGFPREFPVDGVYGQNLQFSDNDQTMVKTYLGGTGLLVGNGALDNTHFPPATVQYTYVAPIINTSLNGTLTIGGLGPVGAGGTGFNHISGISTDNPQGYRDFVPGDVIAMSNSNAVLASGDRPTIYFEIVRIIDNNNAEVKSNLPDEKAFVPAGQDAAGNVIGAWRLSSRRLNTYQRDFGAPAFHGKFLTPVTPLTTYAIDNPQMQLCSIQLTDAIQRTLNEFSAINGLEIVYADYDRTSTPLAGAVTGVYTEVRKSASRALAAYARIVRNTPNTHQYDSFASLYSGFWNNYQFRLGSLYQDVDLRRDGVLALMYAYTQDAFDRYHPKAAPTMTSLRGTGIDWNKLNLHPTEVHAEHGPDAYISPYSSFGKWGSFVNGNTTVGVTLERSSLFDLSGIPINNSRVLALSGEFDMSYYAADTSFRALLYIFLKYVRLARIFLVNCEVEQ
jgi:hypothetical protein